VPIDKELAEIKERRKEMRSLLEQDDGNLDLDRIREELEDLERREEELNRQKRAAEGKEHMRTFETWSPDGRTSGGYLPGILPSSKSHNRRDLRSYAAMFPKENIPASEFRTFREYMVAVADRRPELRTFQVQDPSLGGYAVPTQWAGWLLDQSLEGEIVRPRARNIGITQGDTLKIPAWQSEDRSEGVYGGFVGQWLQELEEANIQTGAVRSVELKAQKLAIYSAASREVLQDAIQFESMLVFSLRDSIGFYLDKAFLAGNGVDEPQGLLNCSSAANINRAEAEKIGYVDLAKMYAALWKQGGRPAWICSHEVVPELLTLKDEAGNLIFQPSAAEGVPATLFGYPLISTEKTGTQLGQRGDIMLANLTGYCVALKQGVVLDISNAPGWTRDRIDFRIVVRADGKELWDQPIATASGKQLSWLVVLDVPQA